ncbi:helix-turn-helix transcriptional regulator [Actinomyces minihominis]|uniref:helix-turn-helix transcriptional regulator n=1 Tax=Actinomyces minihominis TaxID=2002838 RepID=UPI000C083005|nr:helix-turn-helix domain-containing protein [Actinomyces minihominis]
MDWDADAARSFGKHLPELRKEAHLSQARLGHQSGITKNQVQLIEAGRGSSREGGPISNPRMKTLFGLANALGIGVEGLLGHECDGETQAPSDGQGEVSTPDLDVAVPD